MGVWVGRKEGRKELGCNYIATCAYSHSHLGYRGNLMNVPNMPHSYNIGHSHVGQIGRQTESYLGSCILACGPGYIDHMTFKVHCHHT